MLPILYAITDRAQYGETELERRAGVLAQASRLAVEGVDYIQLREKDISAQNLIGLAQQILSAIKNSRSGTRLLISARPDIALICGADGVHLPSGAEQLTPQQIRQLFESAGQAAPVVSVSCHTLAEVDHARQVGADLILFGPVFGKSIGGEAVVPGIGLEALRSACERAGETPLLALGGITAASAASAIAAGAKGIAAIRLFR